MFDFKSLYEAKDLLDAAKYKKNNPDAVIICGGTDVAIAMRDGKHRHDDVLSIQGINEICGVDLNRDGDIVIGAATTFTELVSDPIITKNIYPLSEAALSVGSHQIRNIGTIGGNISNGVTSADTSSTLHAYDAQVKLVSCDASCKELNYRIIPISDYYVSAGKTSIRKDEILSEIIINKSSYKNYYGTYIKYSARNAMDIATLGTSVNIKLTDNCETVESLRIAYGVAGPVPMRVHNTESTFNGCRLSEFRAEDVANSIQNEINPRDSWRASKDFRLHIAKVNTVRGIKASLKLAKEACDGSV